jgi:hypothetical protein
MNYLIVLFKNKERKKIIKSFKTYENAKKFYDNQIISNKNIKFNTLFENGKSCSFEIGILEKNSKNFDSYFIKDKLGRQVKVELDDSDYTILSVSEFLTEELLYDIQTSSKISFDHFIKKYLPKDGLKLVSKINNKIVVQNDDKFDCFSLKSVSESGRFLDVLGKFLQDKNRMDCILVPDSSKSQKKYLYDILEKGGIPKSKLYRTYTTYKR